MSCGEPHETDCSEVLDHLYEFLDREMPDADCTKFEVHFEECSPCLEKYGLEQAVKKLVKRCCGQDDVPTDLRAKVMGRIDLIRSGEAVPDARGVGRGRGPARSRPGAELRRPTCEATGARCAQRTAPPHSCHSKGLTGAVRPFRAPQLASLTLCSGACPGRGPRGARTREGHLGCGTRVHPGRRPRRRGLRRSRARPGTPWPALLLLAALYAFCEMPARFRFQLPGRALGDSVPVAAGSFFPVLLAGRLPAAARRGRPGGRARGPAGPGRAAAQACCAGSGGPRSSPSPPGPPPRPTAPRRAGRPRWRRIRPHHVRLPLRPAARGRRGARLLPGTRRPRRRDPRLAERVPVGPPGADSSCARSPRSSRTASPG